jgi:putative ABC transport system permease protein
MRSLLKSPLFTLSAIATLALGIGANTAVFSVLHSVVLAPLPFPAEDRLVVLPSSNAALGVNNGGVSADDLLEWRDQNRHFTAVAGHRYYYFNITKITPPLQVSGARTTDDFFKIMGIAPQLGRTWEPRDFQPGAAPVCILGHAVWAGSYGADPNIIGRTIYIDDKAVEVVGVMPAGFRDVYGATDLWTPEPLSGPAATPGGGRWWAGVAQLKPGADLAQARAEIQTIAAAQAKARPERNAGWTADVQPARRALVEGIDTGLALLGGAGACLLLITCANVGGLVIARAQSRGREVAIRSALGATRFDLFRQFLAEGLALGLAGGALGVLLAWVGVPLIVHLLPAWFPRTNEISVNSTTLAVTALLSTLTGIVFGVLPVLGSRRYIEPARNLQSRGDSPGVGRARRGLMIAEVALSVILLTGAGLMVRSFLQIQNVPPGIQARGLIGMAVYPTESRYTNRAERKLFFEAVLEKVRAVPGVTMASITRTTPFTWGITTPFEITGRPTSPGETPVAYLDSVDPDFLRTMGIPLRAGRQLVESDVETSPMVMIINEAMAKKYFPNQNPVGQTLTLTDYPGKPTLEIVGVSGDVRRAGLTSTTPVQMYVSYRQLSPPFATIMLRGAPLIAPAALVKSVHRAIWSVNPDQPIGPEIDMQTLVENSVGVPRLGLILFGIFAGVALLLAAVGLYGIIAYSVGSRTREIGIRMALGAQARQIFSLILREGGMLVGIGLALGLVASLALSRLMSNLLFGISPTDPLSFLLVIPLLALVAFLATSLPARRATRIDPNTALRSE